MLTRWFRRSFRSHSHIPELQESIETQSPSHGSHTNALKKGGPPPQAITGNSQIYKNQSTCLLISRLPIELRDAVWEYLLGHNTIHMFWHDRDTLQAFICGKQAKCVSVAHEENRGQVLTWGSASHVDEGRVNQEKGFLPLLLTCRAIYFEATRILYSTTHFDFSEHWPNLQYLPWSIPLTSLSQITHVNIACHGVPTTGTTRDSVSWNKMWETLALCKGLRDLKVEIVNTVSGPPGDPSVSRKEVTEREDELLKPVERMREVVREGKGIWVLRVPFDEWTGGRGVAKGLVGDGWRIVRV